MSLASNEQTSADKITIMQRYNHENKKPRVKSEVRCYIHNNNNRTKRKKRNQNQKAIHMYPHCKEWFHPKLDQRATPKAWNEVTLSSAIRRFIVTGFLLVPPETTRVPRR